MGNRFSDFGENNQEPVVDTVALRTSLENTWFQLLQAIYHAAENRMNTWTFSQHPMEIEDVLLSLNEYLMLVEYTREAPPWKNESFRILLKRECIKDVINMQIEKAGYSAMAIKRWKRMAHDFTNLYLNTSTALSKETVAFLQDWMSRVNAMLHPSDDNNNNSQSPNYRGLDKSQRDYLDKLRKPY